VCIVVCYITSTSRREESHVTLWLTCQLSGTCTSTSDSNSACFIIHISLSHSLNTFSICSCMVCMSYQWDHFFYQGERHLSVGDIRYNIPRHFPPDSCVCVIHPSSIVHFHWFEYIASCSETMTTPLFIWAIRSAILPWSAPFSHLSPSTLRTRSSRISQSNIRVRHRQSKLLTLEVYDDTLVWYADWSRNIPGAQHPVFYLPSLSTSNLQLCLNHQLM